MLQDMVAAKQHIVQADDHMPRAMPWNMQHFERPQAHPLRLQFLLHRVDPRARREMIALLGGLRATKVLATHDMALAAELLKNVRSNCSIAERCAFWAEIRGAYTYRGPSFSWPTTPLSSSTLKSVRTVE